MSVKVTIPGWKNAPLLVADVILHADTTSDNQQRVTITDNMGLNLVWTGSKSAVIGNSILKRDENDKVLQVKIEFSTDGKTWKPAKVQNPKDLDMSPYRLTVVHSQNGDATYDDATVLIKYLLNKH